MVEDLKDVVMLVVSGRSETTLPMSGLVYGSEVQPTQGRMQCEIQRLSMSYIFKEITPQHDPAV